MGTEIGKQERLERPDVNREGHRFPENRDYPPRKLDFLEIDENTPLGRLRSVRLRYFRHTALIEEQQTSAHPEKPLLRRLGYAEKLFEQMNGMHSREDSRLF